MRAVWSLWTRPYQAHRKYTWMSQRQFLFSWVLSVETARQHYKETCLITDDNGARMLVDGLGLRFCHVSTELSALKDHDPEWWALGKVYAYKFQTKPFVHIDNDVFLWKPLPQRMECAAVLAQNPEYFTDGMSSYRPGDFEAVINNTNGGWWPEEWIWYRSAHLPLKGECCGIFGGTRLDFIRHYATLSTKLVEHPYNHNRWHLLKNKIGHNILFEQFFLSACLEYHKGRMESPYKDIDIEYLFESWEASYSPGKAAEAGYTHLIGDAKKNTEVSDRLKKRILRDYPEYYERCNTQVERFSG